MVRKKLPMLSKSKIRTRDYIIDNDCAEVTKRGYYFAGWSTSADGSDGVLLKKRRCDPN